MIGICTDNRQCALTHSKEKDEGGHSRLGEMHYCYQNLYVTGLLHQCNGLVYTIEEVIDFPNCCNALNTGQKDAYILPSELANLFVALLAFLADVL